MKAMRGILFLWCGVFLMFVYTPSLFAFYGAPYAIMPLGDSITYGYGESDENGTQLNNSYRKPLYYSLEADGFQFDFVGSRENGIFPDPDHEGYCGRTADVVADEIYGQLESNYADIVLLHIGTNDISAGQSPSEILPEVESILDEIARYDPAITVCVANIINSREDGAAGRRETASNLNDLLTAMVDDRSEDGENIVSVDLESALDYAADAGDLFDNLHPTEVGYAKMAAVWLPVLEDLMGASSPPPIEAGEVSVGDQWVHVDLEGVFSDPIVVATSPSLEDDVPGVVRICNVSTGGFDIRIQEWAYLDDDHALETLGYLVVERGQYMLKDGTLITADSFETAQTADAVSVSLEQEYTCAPVIVASIMTCNDADAVTGRIRAVSPTGFEYRMQQEESSMLSHLTETVGYLAWEPGSGMLHEIEYEVGYDIDNATDEPELYLFQDAFTFSPVFIASLQTDNESDPASLRFQTKNATGITLFVDEESSLDAEVVHASETVGYIALSHKSLDPDPDGDGVSSEDETAIYGTDPTLADTDGDGLDDGEEIAFWSEHGSSWNEDGDGDDLVNLLDSDADNDGELDGTEVEQGSDPSDFTSSSPVQTTLVFETGEVILDHDGAHITFSGNYTDPVVIFGPASCYDDSPAVVRVSNATSAGCEVRVQEWEYEDGTHGSEIVNYLVLEKGKYLLEDGTRIIADMFQTTGETGTQSVVMPVFLNDQPVVVTSVNTENEGDAVTGRVADVTALGFSYTLQEEETSDQEHVSETVAYIAWEPSLGSVNGTTFEVARPDTSITHELQSFTWTGSFDSLPAFIGGMQTMEGTDPAAVRFQNRTQSGIAIKIDEERSLNDEVEHYPESIGYILLSQNSTADDQDGDGIVNEDEIGIYGTDPQQTDTDDDGLSDGEEVAYWGDEGWGADADGDGVVNLLDPDSDNDGDLDGAEIEQGTDPADADSVSQSESTLVFETGRVTADHGWQHVTFVKIYSDPVVVAGPVSYNGTDPSTVRLRDVTPQGCDIRVQEWDYLDEVHAQETIGYLVMEKGKYILDDGTRICAQTFTSTGNSEARSVVFSQVFTELPVVVAAVNTENDTAAVTGRIHDLDLYGFDYTLQEEEASDQEHAEEQISCIAWEPSAGEEGGITFEVARTEAVVDEMFYSQTFAEQFGDVPVLLGDMQGMEGTDPAQLRLDNTTSKGFEVRVDEEASMDSEIVHVSEIAGYMAFSEE